MKARLRLARALLPRPRVLLLDEPTGAIDPIAAHGLLKLIMDQARERGLAILLSSHRLEEIEALQSYALLLDNGRVRYSGDLDRLRDAWEEPGLELTFSDRSIAQKVSARLAASGIPCSTDDVVVSVQLVGRAAIGDLLCELSDKERRDVRRVREVPMPLRDLIAHIYSEETSITRRVS
jgi:ABC-2 type transport system ATP-binding protein